ncbi:MAG: ferritin family protein [Bacteroidota bacterium]
MQTKSPTDILKMAILLEKRGKAFYTQVAQQTQDEEVRTLFTFMAEEEQMHGEFLARQFSFYEKNKSFDTNEMVETPGDDGIIDKILNEGLKTSISAAGYEAAAISAAIDFENRAIDAYASRAAEATDPNEKEMFTWLADWERGHHHVLYKMDEELKERIWNDNNFWPF